MAPDGAAATIAVAGRGPRGLTVEVAEARPGTGWVVARVAELAERRRAPIHLDARSPAGSLIQALEDAGVAVVKVSLEEHQQACQGLLDKVRDGRLVHRDAGPIKAAILGAERRLVGDAWLWSRRTSKVDISPLVAVTLAVGAAGEPVVSSVYEERGAVSCEALPPPPPAHPFGRDRLHPPRRRLPGRALGRRRPGAGAP